MDQFDNDFIVGIAIKEKCFPSWRLSAFGLMTGPYKHREKSFRELHTIFFRSFDQIGEDFHVLIISRWYLSAIKSPKEGIFILRFPKRFRFVWVSCQLWWRSEGPGCHEEHRAEDSRPVTDAVTRRLSQCNNQITLLVRDQGRSKVVMLTSPNI